MITIFADSYVENILSQLNAVYDDSIIIRRAKVNLDLEKISAGESNICYQTVFSGIEKPDSEYFQLNSLSVEIRFKFLIVNKDSSRYRQIIDRYLFELYRLLDLNLNANYKNADVSAALEICGVKNIKVTKMDNFQVEYFMPSIEFDLDVYDNGAYLSQQILKSESA